MAQDRKNVGQEIGLLFGTILMGIALYPVLSGLSVKMEFALGGFIFLVLAILLPKTLSPLYALWLKLSLLLSKVMTPFVMGVIFFGFITPVSLVMRFFGTDLLQIKDKSRNKDSFWKNKDRAIPFNMKKQF